MAEIILETKNLKKYFPTKKGLLHAVDDINLRLERGKTLGVVGESGCGKSTLGRVILRLVEGAEGQVLFEGEDVFQLNKQQMKARRKDMQIIFQDPYASLNPRMSVFDLIAHPLRENHMFANRNELRKRVLELMDMVGLSQRYVDVFPHQLDGGRRQRIGVARALALNPKFIVCDEPVSALDVSIQAQILNLLMDLQKELDLSYLFITHDLSVVRHISDEILVMYMGQCVEFAPADELFEHPTHPYTRALLNAVLEPTLDDIDKEIVTLRGEVSSPIDPKPGCRFAPRCPYASERCFDSVDCEEVTQGHVVRCPRALEGELTGL